MVSIFVNFWFSFIAGLSAPLLAVCVLPLYPGFLAYLSNQLSGKESRKTIVLLGLIVTGGVILSMFIFGLIFTFFLQESLTKAIGIISPIAFGILGIVSLLLIFNVEFSKFIPKYNVPITKNPYFTSLLFGFFFGAIVLPCNPASLIVLFAISTSTTSFLANLLNFVLFGAGMGVPLLILAFISSAKNNAVMHWLNIHKKGINIVTGLFMLGVTLYYLFFVFRIFG